MEKGIDSNYIEHLVLKALIRNTFEIDDLHNANYDINSIPRISISRKDELHAANEYAYRHRYINILMLGMSIREFHYSYNQKNCYILDSRNNIHGIRFDYIIINNITELLSNNYNFRDNLYNVLTKLQYNCKILAIG